MNEFERRVNINHRLVARDGFAAFEEWWGDEITKEAERQNYKRLARFGRSARKILGPIRAYETVDTVIQIPLYYREAREFSKEVPKQTPPWTKDRHD